MAKNLSNLRSEVRQKADIENDGQHITDAEVDGYIQDAVEKLHSLLVDGTDGQLFAKNAPVLTKLGTNSYQLPADFGQLVTVDVRSGGSRYVRSIEADPQDYAQLTDIQFYGPYQPRYHYLRWNIEQGRGEVYLFPPPDNTSDIAVQYVPQAPVLDSDTATLNWPDFWAQWVVFDAAIMCAAKSDNTAAYQTLGNERERVERRIRDHIRSMSVSETSTIRKNWGGAYRWY